MEQLIERAARDLVRAIYATALVSLTEADEPFYQSEAGIKLPSLGEEIFIGTESARKLGEMGTASTSAFRLPGGILSWLLFVVVTIMLIWTTCFRAIYQVFRIPIVGEIGDTNTRAVPLAILTVVVVLGLVLALMLLTGPYSHFQLLR